MKRIIALTLLTFLLTYSLPLSKAMARGGDLDETKLAAFIYNFHNNISSPRGKICLYGYDGVIAALTENLPDKTIVVDDTKDTTTIKKCNLAYIASNKAKYMATFIADFNEGGVATIGYLDGFLQKNGTFFLQEGRRGSLELTLNHDIVKRLTIKLNPLIFNAISN